jgi:DNA-binding CsgD family transcriptional regulator
VAIARASGLGGARAEWIAEQWVGTEVELGHWAAADDLVVKLADIIDPEDETNLLAHYYCPALVRRGRLDDARPHIELWRARLDSSPAFGEFNWVLATIAEFDAADGRGPETIEMIRGRLARSPIDELGRLELVGTAARIVANLVDDATEPSDWSAVIEELATWVADATDEVDDHWITTTIALDQLHAELDRLRGDNRASAWIGVAGRWAALAHPYEEAYCRYRAAEAHLAGVAGRSSAARQAATEQLATAFQLATALTAQPLGTKIDGLARRARISVQGPVPLDAIDQRSTDRLGLTPRERDVLDLLAEGKTNGEIGKALFISPKTASVHVSAILRKLRVANRVEAAAVAHRTRHTGDAPS